MKTGKNIYYIDALVILLSFAGVRGNALLFKLLGVESQRLVTDLVLLIVLAYIAINSKRLFNYAKSVYLRPVYFYITILFINVFNFIIEGKGFGVQFDFLVLFILIIVILRGLSKEYYKANKDLCVKWMSRGYIWINLFSVVGAFIAFTLIQIFGPDYTSFSADFLARHDERADVFHYWCYTSMLMEQLFTFNIPFFQQYGFLTGLYHEPHIFAMNAFPCLILLLGFSNKKWQQVLIIVMIVLTFLFSGSLTSLLSLTVCMLVFLFLNSRHKILPTILTISLIGVGVYVFLQVTGSVYTDFVVEKLDDSGSMNYSQNALLFAFSPHTLFGNNFLSSEAGRDMNIYGSWGSADVGFIPFLLNIGFIFTYSINVLRLIFADNKVAKAVGFASLYCLLHSAKSGMVMYVQLTPLFLVFLQYLALKTYGRRKTIAEDTSVRTEVGVVR